MYLFEIWDVVGKRSLGVLRYVPPKPFKHGMFAGERSGERKELSFREIQEDLEQSWKEFFHDRIALEAELDLEEGEEIDFQSLDHFCEWHNQKRETEFKRTFLTQIQ